MGRIARNIAAAGLLASGGGVACAEAEVTAFFVEPRGRENYGKKISFFISSTDATEVLDNQLYLARHRFMTNDANPAELRALEVIPCAYASASDLGLSTGNPLSEQMIEEFIRRNPECDFGVVWKRPGFDEPSGVSLELTSGQTMPLTIYPSNVTGGDCQSFLEFHTAVSGAHIGDGVWGFRVEADVAADRISFYNDLSTITGHTFVGFQAFGQPEEVFGKYPSGSIFGSPGDFRDDSMRNWDSKNTRFVDAPTFARALGRAYLASINRETYDMLSSNCTSFAVEIAEVAGIDPGFVCGSVCSPTEFHERIAAGYEECSTSVVFPTLRPRGIPAFDAAPDIDALVRRTLSDPEGAASQSLFPFAQETLGAISAPAGSAIRIRSSSANGGFVAVAKASWSPTIFEGADISVPDAAEGELRAVIFDRTGLRYWSIPVTVGGASPAEVVIASPAGTTFSFPVNPPGGPSPISPALLVPPVLARLAEAFPELDGNADGAVDAADAIRTD